MDELIPQEKIESEAEVFNISEHEEANFDDLNRRLRKLEIKFEANKIQRSKDYGRK